VAFGARSAAVATEDPSGNAAAAVATEDPSGNAAAAVATEDPSGNAVGAAPLVTAVVGTQGRCAEGGSDAVGWLGESDAMLEELSRGALAERPSAS